VLDYWITRRESCLAVQAVSILASINELEKLGAMLVLEYNRYSFYICKRGRQGQMQGTPIFAYLLHCLFYRNMVVHDTIASTHSHI